MTHDILRLTAPHFYTGTKQLAAILKKNPAMDEGGKILAKAVSIRKHIRDAKQAGYLRRTYSPAYIHRTDNNKMTLNSFDQLGPRWVRDAHEVKHLDHTGWYADEHCNDLLIGVVLCFTRHGDPDPDYVSLGYPTKGKGRAIYMAGTRHSSWDGVTLDLTITDDPDTAARWADSMAEREAESCREEDARYRAGERAKELVDDIRKARRACLTLLRDMRLNRAAGVEPPASICTALRERVAEYRHEIRMHLKEIKELSI
ncbi:MAG: hypothetical protein ACYC36_02505 [Bellilinea sp.]